MKHKASLGLIIVIFCALAAIGADRAPVTQPSRRAPPATQPLRDPTQIDPALAQALLNQAGASTQNAVLQVTRHGLIAITGKPTVALIEVHGVGSYFVQKGSVLPTNVGGIKTSLKVETLTPDNFVLSVDSPNVSLVVH